ncbi:MAG: amino acid ABC transporter permease [Tractidigestivibacter sp.]|jgi:polar amino acid transport system permease protein|uniref:amino acid ABC transporter permease n=1 Tax=Tractidigestivibacter sp. TaxID=2847320 RepID=UPI003D90A3AA
MTNPFAIARGEAPSRPKAALNYLLVCALVLVGLWAALGALDYQMDFSFVDGVSSRIGAGFVMTLEISAASLVTSLLVGALVAAGRGCRVLPVRYLCDLYVRIIRGTPLIMQIYLFYYIIGTALGMEDRFWAGVLILSGFEGAYIAEILRGGLISIDATQRDAARAVGFTRAQTLRHVILPQMVARTLPALTGQFASIVKDSSLLSLIAVVELTQTMREISAANFRLFECYFLLGILYLVITLPLDAVGRYFERRFDFEH